VLEHVDAWSSDFHWQQKQNKVDRCSGLRLPGSPAGPHAVAEPRCATTGTSASGTVALLVISQGQSPTAQPERHLEKRIFDWRWHCQNSRVSGSATASATALQPRRDWQWPGSETRNLSSLKFTASDSEFNKEVRHKLRSRFKLSKLHHMDRGEHAWRVPDPGGHSLEVQPMSA
jgi:hypothetical protein